VNFEKALTALKSGLTVSREEWGTEICLQPVENYNDGSSIMWLPITIVEVKLDVGREVYQTCQADLFAEDWVQVKLSDLCDRRIKDKQEYLHYKYK
jgi:hypothetical protein